MELIDRRKLVSDFWKGVEDCAILSYEDTDELMENAPSVDAVPVVRCRDCKYWGQDVISCSGDDVSFCVNPDGLGNYAHPDDFCSYGERKDGDGNDWKEKDGG